MINGFIHLSYWEVSILRTVGILAAVLLPAGTFVYLFLFKMVSFMQSRLGPMEAGPFGSMQLLAEVGKFLQKEDIVPERADKRLFKFAPYLVVGTVLLVYLAVPFGPDMIFADLPGGVFYILAVSSISSLGVLMAGWSSANKYALIGGLRAAGQLIAYELPMVLAVIGVVIQAGTMNLSGIVAAQASGSIFGLDFFGNPYLLTQFVAFAIFMISVQAELGQTPFDMPIAESELVTGYITEYSGLRFLLFFIGEFASAGAFAAVAATLFLGGWTVPAAWTDLNSNWFNLLGPLIMLTKMMVLAGLIFFVRFTFPRFREDQLQKLAWTVLIPISLVNILATTILKVAF
ncbi:NADH-quinone oxidoreductase subunit H [Aquihabitans sp. G128]|uniref:complex I subunit 1/NuoH family protein n=1 Tax=Aquihabitans sp. G128 TaxID=2849779 RepID=UPI001C24D01D|nr:complex I subunit 1 family protein [Aquihabitans sp. G128]QXC60187.1 NADH-quinone oxidoreductase subunit H [Aquihabitans sp. G128]